MIVDWLAVETDYRAGVKSLRTIAAEHGTSDGSVRRRAKKFGWVRDAGKTKREKVKAHFAGNTPPEPDTQQPMRVQEAISDAASEDIRDMETGLGNARLALNIVHHSLLKMQDAITRNHGGDEVALMLLEPKNIKQLSETNKLNIEVIRRIRGLDNPESETATINEDDWEILKRFKNG